MLGGPYDTDPKALPRSWRQPSNNSPQKAWALGLMAISKWILTTSMSLEVDPPSVETPDENAALADPLTHQGIQLVVSGRLTHWNCELKSVYCFMLFNLWQFVTQYRKWIHFPPIVIFSFALLRGFHNCLVYVLSRRCNRTTFIHPLMK